jgi:2-polyprenyl-6-methoxyphenol hydroxylase-like FAD-dependent oxidoreductase
METWPHLTIQVNDTRIPITGNGFSATGRLELLTLLYAYVERLGVRIEFEHDIASLDQVQDADLIVGANGAFSWVRTENEDQFGTTTDWRPNRFIWYGTSQVFDSLSLTFRDTPQGVFCAHHYRYSPTMSTFLVEVEDATWQRAGFETMSPETPSATASRCSRRTWAATPSCRTIPTGASSPRSGTNAGASARWC